MTLIKAILYDIRSGTRCPARIRLAIHWLAILMAVSGCEKAAGQQLELDSLNKIFITSYDDTVRLRTLKRIVFLWHDINADTARIYINLLRSLSEQKNFHEGVIYADVKLAELYNYSGEFSAAMPVNMANLHYARQYGTPYQIADVYKTIAMGYSMQGRNDSALQHYLSALRIYESNRDSINMAKVMVNIGVVHDNMGDHDRAIAYCKRSKDIFKGKDRNAYRVTLTNLALYQAYNKQYEDAKEHYREAMQIALQDSNFNSLSHIYSGLTEIAYLQKQYPQMIPYASELVRVADYMQLGNVKLKADLTMAKALFFNDRGAEAEVYLNRVLERTEGLEDMQLLKDIYNLYAYLLLKKGDLKQFDKYRQLIDSINLVQNKERINLATKELEARYEAEIKDNLINRQNIILRQKQQWNYVLVGATLALGFLLLVLYSNYLNRQRLTEKERQLQQQRIEQLEREKQLSATQAILQGQDEERSRLAKDLHDGIGGMLSGVKFSFTHIKENQVMTPENQEAYARSMDLLEGIIFELRRVAHNMMPESLLKFGLNASLRDLCNYIEQAGTLQVDFQSLRIEGLEIDKNISVSIYRMIQEFLNNILKHAKATEVLVQVVHDGGHYSITVEDNGIGFDIETIRKTTKMKGMGWMNIQNRVDALGGSISIQSSPQSGTSVLIEFNA